MTSSLETPRGASRYSFAVPGAWQRGAKPCPETGQSPANPLTLRSLRRVGLAVEEEPQGRDQQWRVEDVVVRGVGNDGEPVPGHVVAHPAPILLAAAEPLVELDLVLG